jgi:hypothetical protein
MEGITIQNRVNHNDRPIGISFLRKDHMAEDVIWSLVEKVSQSKSRFNSLDEVIMTVQSVRMPGGFGTRAIKNRGRPLSVMAQLKRSVVVVKASENSLAHALVIPIAKAENNPDYKASGQARKIRPVVQKLLAKTDIDLSGGGGISRI